MNDMDEPLRLPRYAKRPIICWREGRIVPGYRKACADDFLASVGMENLRGLFFHTVETPSAVISLDPGPNGFTLYAYRTRWVDVDGNDRPPRHCWIHRWPPRRRFRPR